MSNVIYFSELQDEILKLISSNILGYKNLRNIENSNLNNEDNDDEKSLANIQEYTSNITKLQEFNTKIQDLFTKAYGQSYSSQTLLSELIKLCSEKYDDTNTTLTNFYSDIVVQGLSYFVQKDLTEVSEVSYGL